MIYTEDSISHNTVSKRIKEKKFFNYYELLIKELSSRIRMEEDSKIEVVPEYYDLNTDIQEIIINLGYNMYKKLQLNKSDDEIIQKYKFSDNSLVIDHKNNEIDELIQINKANKEKHREKITELEENHSKCLDGSEKRWKDRINIEKEKNNELNHEKFTLENKIKKDCEEKNQKELEYERKTYQESKNSLNEVLILKDKEINKLEKDNIHHKDIINEFIGKRNLHGKAKGDEAENKITEMIDNGKLYFDSNVIHIPTERESGSGDSIIHFRSHNLRLMIEMKNKKIIEQPDLDQFEKHYKDDFNSNKIDMALLISYDSHNEVIRNHGDCCIPRYFYDNKVVYLALKDTKSPKEKDETIIEYLKQICKKYQNYKKTSDIPNDGNKTIIEMYEHNLRKFKDEEICIYKEIKQCDKKSKELEIRKEKFKKEKHSFLENMYQKPEIVNNIDPSLFDENKNAMKEILIMKLKKEIENKEIKKVKHKWKETIKKTVELCDFEIDILNKIKYEEVFHV